MFADPMLSITVLQSSDHYNPNDTIICSSPTSRVSPNRALAMTVLCAKARALDLDSNRSKSKVQIHPFPPRVFRRPVGLSVAYSPHLTKGNNNIKSL